MARARTNATIAENRFRHVGARRFRASAPVLPANPNGTRRSFTRRSTGAGARIASFGEISVLQMQAWTSGSFMNLRTSLHAHSPSSQARALIARISLVIGGE